MLMDTCYTESSFKKRQQNSLVESCEDSVIGHYVCCLYNAVFSVVCQWQE